MTMRGVLIIVPFNGPFSCPWFDYSTFILGEPNNKKKKQALKKYSLFLETQRRAWLKSQKLQWIVLRVGV